MHDDLEAVEAEPGQNRALVRHGYKVALPEQVLLELQSAACFFLHCPHCLHFLDIPLLSFHTHSLCSSIVPFNTI